MVAAPGRWMSFPVAVLGAGAVVAVSAHVDLAQVDGSGVVGHDVIQHRLCGMSSPVE